MSFEVQQVLQLRALLLLLVDLVLHVRTLDAPDEGVSDGDDDDSREPGGSGGSDGDVLVHFGYFR